MLITSSDLHSNPLPPRPNHCDGLVPTSLEGGGRGVPGLGWGELRMRADGRVGLVYDVGAQQLDVAAIASKSQKS